MAFAMLAFVTIQAQGRMGNMTPEKMAQMETSRMVKQLKLNSETEAKVADINLKYAKMMSDMRSDQSIDRKDMRQKMQEMQADKDKDLQTVLTPEDFAKYKKQREEMRQRMMERMQRRNADMGGEGGQRMENEMPTQN